MFYLHGHNNNRTKFRLLKHFNYLSEDRKYCIGLKNKREKQSLQSKKVKQCQRVKEITYLQKNNETHLTRMRVHSKADFEN